MASRCEPGLGQESLDVPRLRVGVKFGIKYCILSISKVQWAGITWIQEAGRGGQEAAWDGGAAARSSFTYTKKV